MITDAFSHDSDTLKWIDYKSSTLIMNVVAPEMSENYKKQICQNIESFFNQKVQHCHFNQKILIS